MPTNLNTIFPFDPSGQVNKVNGEIRPVSPNDIVVPESSPFYVRDLVIRDQNGIPLSPAEYVLVTGLSHQTLRSNLPAYFGFKIKKAGVTSITYDYRPVGGDYSINQQAATDLITALSGIQEDVDYNRIRNLPTSFPPVYHVHSAQDISWPGLIGTLNDILEALAIGDSAVMDQVYGYLDLKADAIEVSVSTVDPSQVSLYWKSTGLCICVGEITVSDDTSKEVFHNFRREFLGAPRLLPDTVLIYPISSDGFMNTTASAEYNVCKLTSTGFAIRRRIGSLPTPQVDFDRGKANKRMYIAMGISAANATTSSVPSVVRNYP